MARKHRRIMDGAICNVLPQNECTKAGIFSDIVGGARGHMVLVIGEKPNAPGLWRVATITSTLKDINTNGDYIDNYIPFAPLRKKPFPLQLQLVQDRWSAWRTEFDKYSYLRIDREFCVGTDALIQVTDDGTGHQWRVKAKSVDKLKSHLSRRACRSDGGVIGQLDMQQLMEAVGGLSVSR
ncbi:hypothetical protein BDV95DRAFT_603566 [Massariosphaeria phaeospora]|uniref:Uncharacterized protein n=1 Tax=Massariosphaeria phaeospora TaxID=100035 RepID=A0A7C8IF70_9PLEO|nr:hypothetical protein BDV95DRAFT_603566 [Massariosphaeria phaeospora]